MGRHCPAELSSRYRLRIRNEQADTVPIVGVISPLHSKSPRLGYQSVSDTWGLAKVVRRSSSSYYKRRKVWRTKGESFIYRQPRSSPQGSTTVHWLRWAPSHLFNSANPDGIFLRLTAPVVTIVVTVHIKSSVISYLNRDARYVIFRPTSEQPLNWHQKPLKWQANPTFLTLRRRSPAIRAGGVRQSLSATAESGVRVGRTSKRREDRGSVLSLRSR